MITKSRCRELAEGQLAKISAEMGEPLLLLPAVIESDLALAYFYQSAAHVASGDPVDALAGNAPILINRISGEAILAGTAYPVEHYMKAMAASVVSDASNNSLKSGTPKTGAP